MAQLRADMQRDWIRVGGGLRRAGGMCSACHRGRDAQLTREAYLERWCHRGVLCSPDRWRWRAAVPLERCRAGAAASMTTQPVSTLSFFFSGHPDALRMRRLAEAHVAAGWNSGLTCR